MKILVCLTIMIVNIPNALLCWSNLVFLTFPSLLYVHSHSLTKYHCPPESRHQEQKTIWQAPGFLSQHSTPQSSWLSISTSSHSLLLSSPISFSSFNSTPSYQSKTQNAEKIEAILQLKTGKVRPKNATTRPKY